MPTRSIRSAEAAGAVAASLTGRVCGAGAGKAPSPTTMRTRHERASPDHGVGEGPPVQVGLGADQVQHVAPGAIVTLADDRCWGQVSSVVTPLTMRATGRRARWSKKCSPLKVMMGSVGLCPNKRGDGGGGAQSGVDPAFEADHQHGAVQFRLAMDREHLGQSVGAHGWPPGTQMPSRPAGPPEWGSRPRCPGPPPRHRPRSGRRRPEGCRPASSSRRRCSSRCPIRRDREILAA